MRSKYLPPHYVPGGADFDGMDIDLNLDMGQQGASGSGSSPDDANDLSTDWEQWGEDSSVNLTVVQFDFNGYLISRCLFYNL